MRVKSRERPGAESPIASEQEIDLSGMGRAIRANGKWVVGATLAALLASTAFVNIVKPRYTAETRVLLELQDSYMPGSDKKVDQGAMLDPEAVGSQIQLVTSRDVARRAIKQIGLLGNREFDPMADGMGAVSRMLVLLGVKRDPTQLSPEDRVLENYYDKLQVFSPTKTRVLNIEFQAHDPDLAAKAANTIAGIYLDFQQDAKRDLARSAAGSLGNLVAGLKTRISAAEAKAEDFRSQSGLFVGSNNATIGTQQLGEVNTELSRARTSQADAQAKAKLIRDMIKQGRVSEIPDVASNDLVRRISEQRVTLRAQLALESRTLLPGHPRIKELNAQLADLENALHAAGDKAARTLENDARIAHARVQNLQTALDQQKQVVGSSSADEVKMRELDRAVKSLKEELEGATSKYQEALARENSKSTPADARIVSRAIAPQVPSFPKKLPIIGFSTLAALFLSVAAVVARQLLADDGAQRRHAPVRDFKVDREIIEPDADEAPPKTDSALLRAVDAPAASLLAPAQAFASRIADDGRRPALALIVCDHDEDDGFSLATGRAMARRGRTIMVALDASVRMPATDGPGMAELLSGRATFDETIHRDPISRLHILGPGAGPSGGADALLSALDALLEAYEHVLVAGSADLDIDEALALSQLATAAAVYARDEHSAATLADTLEGHGLPHVVIVGARDAREAQTAA